MGVATFSSMFASFHYYSASLCSRFDEVERTRYARRADRLWLLFLAYLVFQIREYPKIETMLKSQPRPRAMTPIKAADFRSIA
jgi:hypothetical protein